MLSVQKFVLIILAIIINVSFLYKNAIFYLYN